MKNMPQDVLIELAEALTPILSPKIQQGFEEILKQKEQEALMAREVEEKQRNEEMRQQWMDEHIGNLKTAFEGDPEYKELIQQKMQQKKFDEKAFEKIVDSLVDYKDKAPAMLKQILRQDDVFNNLQNAGNERDTRYLLADILSGMSNPNASNKVPEKEETLKKAGINISEPSYIDEEIADSISRM